LSIRLNKLLAQRGIGARRKCDELIQRGAVQVNGAVVREPGTQVEPDRDRVVVNGQPLPGPAPLRYYALNKPVGVITTLHDPEGRRTIAEFLPKGPRLYPVGRLDADTSGLLILTNDGELAHRLMHPRYGVEKVYRVRVATAPNPGQVERLKRGVEFEPGVRSAPARVRVLDETPGGSLVSIALHEGRYRQVRRMCEAVGLQVMGLHRSAYGPLRLGELSRGIYRELSEEEVAALRSASARPNVRARGHHSRVPRRHEGGGEGAPGRAGGPRAKPARRSAAEAAFGVPSPEPRRGREGRGPRPRREGAEGQRPRRESNAGERPRHERGEGERPRREGRADRRPQRERREGARPRHDQGGRNGPRGERPGGWRGRPGGPAPRGRASAGPGDRGREDARGRADVGHRARAPEGPRGRGPAGPRGRAFEGTRGRSRSGPGGRAFEGPRSRASAGPQGRRPRDGAPRRGDQRRSSEGQMPRRGGKPRSGRPSRGGPPPRSRRPR
jgi:23S rRNA pseudouridine2605 synthase